MKLPLTSLLVLLFSFLMATAQESSVTIGLGGGAASPVAPDLFKERWYNGITADLDAMLLRGENYALGVFLEYTAFDYAENFCIGGGNRHLMAAGGEGRIYMINIGQGGIYAGGRLGAAYGAITERHYHQIDGVTPDGKEISHQYSVSGMSDIYLYAAMLAGGELALGDHFGIGVEGGIVYAEDISFAVARLGVLFRL